MSYLNRKDHVKLLEVLLKLCDLCRRDPCHPQCPNYMPSKASHYCSICGDGIYDGEEYIENLDGEYRHYDCFHGLRELLDWLGYEVKTMEEEK